MRQQNMKDIEDKLTELKVPQAPQELLDQIKAEIPETVLFDPADPSDSSLPDSAGSPALWRRPWVVAATVLLAAALVYRLQDQLPQGPSFEDSQAATQSLETSSIETPERMKPEPQKQTGVQQQGLQRVEVQAPAATLRAEASPIPATEPNPSTESPRLETGSQDVERRKKELEGRRSEVHERMAAQKHLLQEGAPPAPRAFVQDQVGLEAPAERTASGQLRALEYLQMEADAGAPTGRSSTVDGGQQEAETVADSSFASKPSHAVTVPSLAETPAPQVDSAAPTRGTVYEEPATAATRRQPPQGAEDHPVRRPATGAVPDMFFADYGTNPFVYTDEDPLSTFGLDVDTGSYTIARRYLEEGQVPPREAVRVEEFINYFDYRDPAPKRGDFAIHASGGPSPFAPDPRYKLVRFNLSAREVSKRDRQPATLVFVVDVSGSMNRENRLGLVKQTLSMLLGQLGQGDRVGLVIYGSQGQVLLEPTDDLLRIERAIEQLQPGGSTNAEEGLLLAYNLMDKHFSDRSTHRIILCSDGVANVGNTGPESILRRIGKSAQQGIELTTVGFGLGNYNDVLMEQLADQGDGNYAYVDSLKEAYRVFVENLSGTLQTVAADAKLQVEFNPNVVSRYRLLGYENRDVADHLFREDSVDAGEIGAGHSVTALYAVKLMREVSSRDRLAEVRLRYYSKREGKVTEASRLLTVGDLASSWARNPRELQLTAVVAQFAETLKRFQDPEGSQLNSLLVQAEAVAKRYKGDEDVAELLVLLKTLARQEREARRLYPE